MLTCKRHILKQMTVVAIITAAFLLLALSARAQQSAKHFAPLKYKPQIDTFYLTRQGTPVWIDDQGALTTQGKALAGVLNDAWQNGLNPNNYYNKEIQNILAKTNGGEAMNSETALHLELLLTSAYTGYIRDISGMRVEASTLSLRAKDWRQKVSAQLALSYLPDHARNIAAFLKVQEPQTRTYQALKSELIALVNKQKEGKQSLPVVQIEKTLYPGNISTAMPTLRARLNMILPPERANDQNTYDVELVQAVKNFQQSQGLKPDGIIGKQTIHALNLTTGAKIKQIMANMERLRWVEDEKPSRFVVVNIPSASLWAIEDGVVLHEMPVVVGRKKRETLSFVTYIHGVRFNPTWTVPPTIKEEDIWPKLKEDATYLASKGMELFDGYAKDAPTLDPTAIDWHAVTEQDLHGLRMVQIPGAHNPLGRFRILMPNEYNIYLHDTNERGLFYKTDRALSSGCIRMKNPDDIARYVLKNRRNWDESKMQDILKTGEVTDIYTSEKIPVYLLYYTVWLGAEGQVVYGQDIYGYDQRMIEALEKLDGFPKIGDTEG